MQQLHPKSPSLSLANDQFHGSQAHLHADPEDFERHQRVLNKRHERITSHLDCFIRLQVCLDRPEVSFHVVADRRNTIEYLTHQIEAEYVYKYAFPISEEGKDSTPIEGFMPLEVGELTAMNSVVLKYEDVIGESLDPDLVVNVVNVFEINGVVAAEPSEESDVVSIGLIDVAEEPERAVSKRGTVANPAFMAPPESTNSERHSAISSLSRRKSNQSRRRSIMSIFTMAAVKEPVPNMDDALLFEMLRNLVGIEMLISFCLTDFTVENLLFWLDVQVFRSCPENLASQFGGYIYNMYLVSDAPVKVNVAGDLMYDINGAIVNQVGVDMTMFDDAQQHVYSLLKMKTLTRFKKSKLYASFESYRAKNEELYKSKSFSGKFYDGLCFKKPPTLGEDAPKAEKKQSGIDDDGAYRDIVLERVVRRYARDCRFFDEHGYYADPDQSSEIDRTQRKKMEKKLSKFFGERPGASDLDRQKYMIDCLKKAVADTNAQALLSQFDQEASHGASDVSSSELPGVNADGSVNVAVLKKKKFEKLVDFFGEPLPRDERKFLNNDHMLQYPEKAALGKYKSHPSLDALEAEAVDTVNDLTPDEKRNMTKKARKIINVLGDQSAEKKLKESRGSVFQQRPSASLNSNAGKATENEEASAQMGTPLQNMIDQLSGSTSDSSEDSDEEEVNPKNELTEEEMKQIRKLRKKRLSKLTAFLGEEAGMIEVASTPNVAKQNLTKEEKVQQRKRLQKLERVMGELVTTDILENALDVTEADYPAVDPRGRRFSQNTNPSAAKKKPMTVFIGFDPVNELKEVRTVNAALSEIPTISTPAPPTDRKRAASKHHENLVKLNKMLQEESIHRALDLMDEMLDFNIDAVNAIKSKSVRKKKLKKLRKFFGDTLNPVQLFEKNVVAELEMTIADEVEDPEELKKLNEELTTLRGQVALRVSELQQGWDERQSRRSQVSVDRASVNSTKEQ
ncbi:hypothetical protein HDU81_007288 [Chytriomyces hyalinus]|nr:hypothetical protein HDU81_007288 [Chytriomyces hyalinus]